MTPKPTRWNELHLAENPAVQLLQSLDYTYIPPEDLEPERASFKEAILTGRLVTALERLNPWLSDTNLTKAVKTVTQVPAASLAEANETLYTSLTYGIALEQDRSDGRKSHTVRFLDFDKPSRNEWIVTRQYKVLGSKKHVIPDIVVFVNARPPARGRRVQEPHHRRHLERQKPSRSSTDTRKPAPAGRTRAPRSCSRRRRFSSPPAASAPSTARSAPRRGSFSHGRSRLPELQIIGQTIDQVFDRVFADRTEDERAVIKQRFATEQAIAGAPRRIEAICLDLIDHFTRFIAPNGFKAQVVATSRHAAVTYKETLDRLNAPESTVIMSAGHNDEARLAHWHLRKDEQDRLIERFKDHADPLAILVVCDMLLTGFDAPIEQVMYLDAPLKEHTLLQAIARVNRPHGDEKTYGLVVDYWGVSAKLQDALAIFSTTDVQGALTPSVDELPRLQSRHAAAIRFFQAVADPNDLNACVQALEPEDVRAEFDLAFRRFGQSMDMLLPDRRALAYNADLRWLGKIRGAARARYRDDRLDLSGCGEKVRKLIADAVGADGVQILVKEVQLFSPEFEEKVEALRTDEAKASEMEHAIRHEISVRLEENPAFYQSLRERLEAIIEERRQERLDAAKQLSLLNSLREELKGEQTRAQDIGLDARGFAIYGLLEEQRPMPVREDAAPYSAANRDLASLIDEEVAPFTELVDWWQKDDLQRQMRSKIKRQLRASGVEVDAVESLAADIVDLAKVRTDR